MANRNERVTRTLDLVMLCACARQRFASRRVGCWGLLLWILVACGERRPTPASSPRAVLPPAASGVPAAPIASGTSRTAYPETRRSATADVLHGVEVADPYRWLEDASNAEVQAWMATQDTFARERLSRLPLTEALRQRFSDLYYVDQKWPPQRHASRWFWAERQGKQEKAVIYWREGKTGEPRVLIDPNRWSADGSISLGGWWLNRAGTIIAYQVKLNAADESTLEFLEVRSGKKLASDSISGAKYSFSIGWSWRDDGVYYTWVPPVGTVPTADRPGYAEIRFHRLGTDPAKDPVIRERTGDPKTFTQVWSQRRDSYAFHTVRRGWVSRDVYLLDLRKKDAQWLPLIVGEKANYYPVFSKSRLFVRTDEGAPRGRVFEVNPRVLDRKHWKQVIPEDPRRTLKSLGTEGGKLVLGYLDDVKSSIEIRDVDGKLERVVDLPGVGTADLWGHPDDDEAYLTFTTFTQPTQIFRTSISKGGRTLYSEVKVPFDASPYLVEQIFATSKDGTRVPAFVVRRKDAPLDGTAPLLLLGYGGFGLKVTPEYWGSIVPWLERGGIAAFANLRGGGEYGETWHRDGMRLKKQNSIDDFHGVAESLVKSGYTRPERLAIRGASNGGLLVSAAITQRPELYATALCGVPLTDMVRYHLVGSGKTWIEEYGSSDDPAEFRVLHQLSPYHHVARGTKYPSMLLTTADTDDRVDPMHARKFAAMLQARSSGGDVLLRIEKKAGHAGAGMIKATIAEQADSFAFLMHAVRMDAESARAIAY